MNSTTIDLDTLTPEQYTKLPDYIRANLPEDVKTRLWHDLDRAWLDLVVEERRQREAVAPSDPDTDAAFLRRIQAMDAGVDPDTGEKLADQGEPTDLSQLHVGENPLLETVTERDCGRTAVIRKGGQILHWRVRCRCRACPVCGEDWGTINYDAFATLERETDTNWTAYIVQPAERARFRQAVKRSGGGVGVSMPCDFDGIRVVVTTASVAWHNATPVDDVHREVKSRVATVTALAAAAAEMRRDERPKVGPISGVGEWRTELAAVKAEMRRQPDEDDDSEFLGFAGRTTTLEELERQADEWDVPVTNRSPGRFTVEPRTTAQLHRWLGWLGIITPDEMATAREARLLRRLISTPRGAGTPTAAAA